MGMGDYYKYKLYISTTIYVNMTAYPSPFLPGLSSMARSLRSSGTIVSDVANLGTKEKKYEERKKMKIENRTNAGLENLLQRSKTLPQVKGKGKKNEQILLRQYPTSKLPP